MKFKIKDNHLLIYYNNGTLKEDATENQNECKYCVHNPKVCKEKNANFGGQFCDYMKCRFEEIDEE